MRLGEATYVKGDSLENLGERIDEIMVNHFKTEARVEVHSLDDPPWSTERPEGWGVGCWCEYTIPGADRLLGIVTENSSFYLSILNPEKMARHLVSEDEITAFGPRAEVPR